MKTKPKTKATGALSAAMIEHLQKPRPFLQVVIAENMKKLRAITKQAIKDAINGAPDRTLSVGGTL